MQNKNSQQITMRFFQALHVLIERRQLRGVKTFTDRYGINRRNFTEWEKDPSRDMFEIEWFAVMCRDFGVNPYWLLSGSGEMFTADLIEGMQRSLAQQVAMGVGA